MPKTDDDVLKVLKSIDQSLARIATALREDSSIDQSLAMIAKALNDDGLSRTINSVALSLDDVVDAIRGRGESKQESAEPPPE